MTKLYMLETPSGNRGMISSEDANALLMAGKHQKIIDTAMVCVLRIKKAVDLSAPERKHYLGGGRLRHPFS